VARAGAGARAEAIRVETMVVASADARVAACEEGARAAGRMVGVWEEERVAELMVARKAEAVARSGKL